MNPVGTVLQLGATTANNVTNTAINNLLNPGGGVLSPDNAIGSANNFGFGESDMSGGWNTGDVYTPSQIVNPDFSLGDAPTSNVGDINSYLDSMRAAEAPGGFTGGGTSGYGQLSGGNSYDMGSTELSVSPQLQAYLNSLTAEQMANLTEADLRANGAGAAPVSGPVSNVQNVANRTPEQEAQYAAQLAMESNLAAQRYGADIGFNGSPLTPSTRQK